ncbi:MAG: hypothetical protein JWQ01_4802 [Massilia sp.]|nr:hypothetical protein [Massilia sp.]
MRAQIKFLRSHGIRKPDRVIIAEPTIDGELTLALCGNSYDLKLSAPDDSQLKPLVPVLSDARLISMHGDKMLFSGTEQPSAEGPQYGQQWSVRVVG